ncbi:MULTISPECIES: CHASE4 domain-containing protein [unclassified Sphingomonas]|uniref:sensor histidine kinase n=1 Tax=Sphingomonas TaxID=13687 RepID=UPI00096264BE|nr:MULTISPECIES: CHASE4 domain-containing protein [unclassified Sphingomonas]MBN8813368.1 HAMP domain-containing protein [Sphingomonas sp.]OJY52877.1 MAG: histidine kinase [Sphingomonas sp. 67-41]
MPRARRLKAPASLGAKLVLILTGVGVIGAAALTLMLATVITPSFNQLERDAVDAHVARTQAVVHDVSAKVENAVRDYGDWNSSYDYMAHPTKAFEDESFSTLAMVNLDVNGMAYVRPDRGIVIARWLDLEKRADVPAMRARLADAIARFDFARMLHGQSSAGFFIRLGDRLAAVGIAQVRRSDGSGEPRGYVLMARAVTAAQLSTLLQLEASLALDHPVAAVTKTPGATRTRIAVPIPGPDGRPVATATYTVPRDLSMLGTRMLVLAVVGSSILLAIVLLVLRRMIARLVLAPLKRVERHMGVVRASGTLGLLTDKPRDDEIGSLVTSFNSMLRQLKDLREQLEVQSFTLGRSESAVAVMHNVRNALNPISTVLSQGLGTGAPMDRMLLDRALGELASETIPAVRRQKLAAFLAAAIESVEQERADRRAQIAIGREALHHVLEIIGQQQEAAHERPPLDACDITDIVAQNATIARYSGENSIAFSFPSKPHWVMANRVILSQVVGNLFANAAEAIAATGRGSGSISVTIRDKGDSTEIHIRDDGEGFDPATAPTLFQRGYSTRAHKSGGLGLHWCANSMLTMEGRLDLVSDGKGTGAKAILTLGTARLAQPSGMAA